MTEENNHLFPDFSEDSENGPNFSLDTAGSFAEAMGGFAKFFEIETKICEYLDATLVPYKATRKLLRTVDNDTLNNDRVLNLLKKILVKSNVGAEVTVFLSSPLVYDFLVGDCNICKGHPKEGEPVCYTTSSAIGRFFKEVLKIGNEVLEIECTKTGASNCVHRVSLEQIDVFSIISNETDCVIINSLKNETSELSEVYEKLDCPKSEIEDSMDILNFYGILKIERGGVSQTNITRPFKIYAENAPPEEEGTLKAWDDLEKIEDVIKNSESLAEVFSSVSEEERPPWEQEGDSNSEDLIPEDEEDKGSLAEVFKSLSE